MSTNMVWDNTLPLIHRKVSENNTTPFALQTCNWVCIEVGMYIIMWNNIVEYRGMYPSSATMYLLLLSINPGHIIGNLVQPDLQELFLCTLREHQNPRSSQSVFSLLVYLVAFQIKNGRAAGRHKKRRRRRSETTRTWRNAEAFSHSLGLEPHPLMWCRNSKGNQRPEVSRLCILNVCLRP